MVTPAEDERARDIRETAMHIEWMERLRRRYMTTPKAERRDLLEEALPLCHSLRDLDEKLRLARERLKRMRAAAGQSD